MGAAESGHAKPHAGPHAARAEPHASPHAALGGRTQACTQVRTRLRRPARRPGQGKGDSLEPPTRRSFSPPRPWKLTGCGKLRTTGHPPPDLPTTVGNPASIHRPGFPQLRTASASRIVRGERIYNSHASIFFRGDARGPAPRPCSRPPWDDHPTAHPLKIEPPSWTTRSPVRADASAPARAPGHNTSGRLPFRPPAQRSTSRG